MQRDKGIRKFSCLIVGSSTLPIRCAEVVLRREHEICAMVSSDPEVRKWSLEHAIPCLEHGPNLGSEIGGPFDYLFSVVNEHILREDVLNLPRQMAINYHDAPLPRYAGTHATSWALINGETSHGISWHAIADLVDGGDILRQKLVDISEDETALTLNTKCYEAAIAAFEELLGDIESGKLAGRKQDLQRRTFYPRFKRPANGGVISWESSARDISALVRALDFGPHSNPLGTAKITVEDEFLIVSAVDVTGSVSENPPGTISEIGTDFLRVSTGDKDIDISQVSLIDGRPIPIPELVSTFNLHKGYRFPTVDPETAKQIEEGFRSTCRQESYWVKKLSDLTPVQPPFANRFPFTVSSEHGSARFSIPSEFSNLASESPDLQNISSRIVAAFGAFIWRLTGEENFDIGFRTKETGIKLPGSGNLFASTVPLRFKVGGRENFEELLKATEEEILSVKQHVTYAYDITSRYPRLRSLLKFDESHVLPIAVVMNAGHCDREHPPSTLNLLVSEIGSECCVIYDKEVFHPESIDRLIGHFTTFLKAIAADPKCGLSRVTLLTEEERRRLLVEWNSNSTPPPEHPCIHRFFEAQVKRTPDADALIFGDQKLTYRELNRRANRVANHLLTLGVGPEVLVAICVRRSFEMIVGILGVLKAGAAYVPLDPTYPIDRIKYILEDSQASVLITEPSVAVNLGVHPATVVDLERDRQTIEEASELDPVSAVTASDLAYVIYTSGSTGKPKGVAIEHRSTAAFLAWATSVFSVEELSGTLASTSVCFDLSIFEMFAPLSCGGSVILVENILHLPDAPNAEEVTLLNTVPSAIGELLRIGGIPDSVRTVNLAGEPLKTSLVLQIYDTGTVQKVFDLYGPTEDTTYSTFTLRGTGKATIGRPISNTQAYVLDKNLQPVPVGIPGELYLGGEGLARGYLNRPELTAEKFIRNPFSTEPSARIYRTGDLVCYLPSGEIEYQGRIDNQVKIRGFRIETGEIEAALASHPAVSETVIVAREDRAGEKSLAAYFVRKMNQTVTFGDLREHLKLTLPHFMIPSAFVELAELPLTPNGKIDRKALPEPGPTHSISGTGFVAHRDELESRLTKIWESILGVHPIGTNDNFFELGGHSLKAVRMFAEIEETFGKNIPLATLFEAGTIEKLARILRQDGWAAPESSIVPIQPVGKKPPFFCIHAKGGNVLFYRDLAKYLGDDQPFYGVQARRLAGRQIGHATVEEMAAYYIKEIQNLQPDGPYYLGGSSFGGLVAFEIAQQLQRQGQRIALLALLDTGTPDYPKILPSTTAFRLKAYNLIRRAQHHRDSLKAFDAKEKADYILGRLRKVNLKYRRKIRDGYKKSMRRFYQATKGTNSIPKSYIQIENLIWRAGQAYVPEIYRGDVTLFRASVQPLGIYPDPTLGWETLVSGVLEIHEVPGHHGSIVAEPYVRVLAEKLRECIELVQLREKRIDEDSKPAKAKRREKIQTAALGSTFR